MTGFEPSGTRKYGYEFLAIELSTGRLSVTAESIFLRSRKRLEHTKEREKHVALVLGEGIAIDESRFSIEEAQLAVKEITENKIHSYEELKNRPWYKKLYSMMS